MAGDPVVRARFWLGLAFAGSAGLLAVTEAGPRVGYQHLLPAWRGATPWEGVVLAALAVQACLAFWGIAKERNRWWPVLRRIAPARGWALMGLGTVGLTSTLSYDPVDYAGELFLSSLLFLSQFGTVVLAANAMGDRSLSRLYAGWRRWVDDTPDWRFVLLIAGVSLSVSVLLAVFSYERHPHVPDEVSYLLGARYLSEGLWWMPIMPVPEGFSVDLMTFEEFRWFSPVPPGWPFALALGYVVGAAWLVNPVLGALNAILVYVVVLELYDRPTARLAAVLFALSPWHLFMSMSFMTHPLSLTCALVAALGVGRWIRGKGLPWLLAAGTGIGLVSTIRPLEGLVVAIVLAVVMLASRPIMRAWGGLALLGGVSMVVGALQLVYNRIMTGDAMTFPIMQYTERIYGALGLSNSMGFGPDRGLGWTGLDPFPGHGILDVMINTNLNLFAASVELFGWFGGSLGLVWLFVLLGQYRRADLALMLFAGVVVFAHAFYWFSGGPDFGARYWYLIIVPGVVLSARAVLLFGERLEDAGGWSRPRVMAIVMILVLVASTTFLPWRAVDKYRGYRGMKPGVERLRPLLGNGLVFVNGTRIPDYQSAVFANPTTLTATDPVFVQARSTDLANQLVQAYSGREIWIVDGPSVTGDRFAVRAGPLAPDEFRAWGVKLLQRDPR